MNFTRYFLVLLVWAFLMEILVLLYYAVSGERPFEFYLNLALMFLTLPSIGVVLYRMIRGRRKDGEDRDR